MTMSATLFAAVMAGLLAGAATLILPRPSRLRVRADDARRRTPRA